ncbi:hypothetical protein BGZ47_003922, partial [Haplosporangium gracile]
GQYKITSRTKEALNPHLNTGQLQSPRDAQQFVQATDGVQVHVETLRWSLRQQGTKTCVQQRRPNPKPNHVQERVLASVQAACGGGKINKAEAADLASALVRIGKNGQMKGQVLSLCAGGMCVSCWDNRHTELELREDCPNAAVAIAQDVGTGSSAWCEYPGLKGLQMVNYFRK